MQNDFATTAARLDILQAGAVRRYETKNWNELRTEELLRRVTFAQEYNRKRGPSHGWEQWTSGQDFQRRNQNYSNDGRTRNHPPAYRNFSPRPNFAYDNNNPNNGNSYRQHPKQSFKRNDGHGFRDGYFKNQDENWGNTGNFSRSPSAQRRDFSQNTSYRQPRSDQPNNSAFRWPDNRSGSGVTSYQQKFPQNINQTSSNVVRFTTTDDSINELSDLCPLNY